MSSAPPTHRDDGDADSELAPASPTDLTGELVGPDTDDSLLRRVLGMTVRQPPSTLTAGHLLDETYRIERQLGAGGMGVVYLARDLRLHRDVAIKLHAELAGERGGERLMREAAAMAQLRHANVVTVYEVGSWAGHPYVAMEYVAGGTVRTWLRTQRRTAREILAVFAAAARGLAAAHAAGLVHRDFKPDNVLIGDDGRVQVADFGLARGFGDEPTTTATTVGGTPQAMELTATGAVVGTPAYMAPEQRAGGSIGPAADQFAYAVSLGEALGDAAPPHVVRALARARSEDPDARFPSMGALLDELVRDPQARRRRVAIGAVAVIAVAGLGAGVMALASSGAPTRAPAPRPVACAGARVALGETWTPQRRDAVRDAFAASGVAGADATFERVARRLDDYAAAWTAQRVEACEATQVRGEQSAAMLDLRNHCLDQRRMGLAATIDILTTDPDVSVIATADSASINLASLDDCRDVPRLDAAPRLPDDPAQRAEAIEIEALIAQARAFSVAGRYPDLLATATKAVDRADQAKLLQLAAMARYWQGFGQFASHQRARATFERAARDAAAAHDDTLTAGLWISVLDTLATEEHELRSADQLIAVAEAAVVRAGDPPDLRFQLAKALGGLRVKQGRLADARAALEQALALGEQRYGKDDPRLGQVLIRLGTTLSDLGDLAGARAAYQRDLEIIEAAYGPDHPHVADIVNNLAGLDFLEDKFEDARAGYQRSIAINERVFGPESPTLASSLSNLAMVLVGIGHADQASPHVDRALAIVTTTYGPDHPRVATMIMMRAEVQVALGDTATAQADLERALAIQTEAMGGDNPEIVYTLRVLGAVLDQRGDVAGAIARLERGLEIIAVTFGPDSAQGREMGADLARLKKKRGRR